MNPHDIGYVLQAKRFSTRAAVARRLGVDPRVSNHRLCRAVARLHHRVASVPWRYDRYFNPSTNQHQSAMKLQPGAQVPVAFNGVNTLMYIDTARRLNYHGKPTWIEMKVKLNTENIPIILTNETKCDCVYCGTSPRGDEASCRGCGAPLDC